MNIHDVPWKATRDSGDWVSGEGRGRGGGLREGAVTQFLHHNRSFVQRETQQPLRALLSSSPPPPPRRVEVGETSERSYCTIYYSNKVKYEICTIEGTRDPKYSKPEALDMSEKLLKILRKSARRGKCERRRNSENEGKK